MTKKKLLLATLTLATTFPLAATAEPYMGLNYTHTRTDDIVGNMDFNALAVKGGYQFTDWFALEARYGSGRSTQTERAVNLDYPGLVIEETYNLKMKDYYGAYALFSLPNSTMFKPYLVAGYTEASFKLKTTGTIPGYYPISFTESEKVDSPSYGIGLNVNFSEHLTANLEYMRMIDDSYLKLDAVSVGLGYRF